MPCNVQITGGQLPQEEVNAYLARAVSLYGREPDMLDLKIDGDFVDIAYHYADHPFQRIRRITAYKRLALDRFNNAKRAEEHDRVKHSIAL